MNDTEALFADGSFENAIQSYCGDLGWPIGHLEDDVAALKLAAPLTGNVQVVYIDGSSDLIEFTVRSLFEFAEGEDPPYSLLLALLVANQNISSGHWCVEYFRGARWASLRRLEPKSQLTCCRFHEVIMSLISDCDDFETEFTADEE